MRVEEISASYPTYVRLNGERDWRATDREITIRIIGTRADLYYKLGLGEKWIHEFNGWGEIVDWDVSPDARPCRLGGATVLEGLEKLGCLDAEMAAQIRKAMSLSFVSARCAYYG